jgi:hypothetical protein
VKIIDPVLPDYIGLDVYTSNSDRCSIGIPFYCKDSTPSAGGANSGK